MNIQKSGQSVYSICQQWSREGKTIAFVPTMGNLHAGHLKLVDKAKQIADKVVVSIFVNPLQFGENEDFLVYPKTIEQDCEKLTRQFVHLIFLPEIEEIYPTQLNESTFIEVPVLSEILCGKSRPGHFRGVATVVNKLFNIVQPTTALFGKKDFQQFVIIKRMVRDLNLPVSVVGLETVRESDGLAMSSRNAYLTTGERKLAPVIFNTLSRAMKRIMSGEKRYADIEAEMMQLLDQPDMTTEYVSIRNSADLSVADATTEDFVVLTAVHLGSTRLIDNLSFSLK